MTISALVVGSLFKPPESRVSKNGKSFVTATLKCPDGNATVQFVRLAAFSETAQAELMRLSDGDTVSVIGPLRVELYAKDGGDTRVSLSIIADSVLALRPPPKERKPKAAQPEDTRTRQERCAGTWMPGAGPSDDDIPF